MDLLTKAIADAKAVKETALANAKLKLEETFQPTLQRMISSKIQEEEADDAELRERRLGLLRQEIEEEGDEEDDVNIDIDFETGEDVEGSDDIGMGSFEDEPEEDFEDEEPVEEGEEEDNLGDSMLEWDDEEMTEEDEFDSLDEEDEIDLEELFSEEDDEMFSESEDEDAMYESDDEEVDLSELFSEEDEEEFAPVQSEVRKLRRENRKLRTKVNESLRAVSTYKKAINEVNLLNAKLLYTTNVIKDYSLNNKQKMQVLEAFDNATSVREVKLINKSIVFAFGKKTIVKEHKGSASKARTVINPSKKALNENNTGGDIVRWSPDRLQQLAGMKDIKY